MTRTVVSVDASTDVDECCSMLLRHHISGLPVLGANQYVAGIITEFDLMSLVLEPDPEKTTVGDYMTVGVTTANEDDSLQSLVDQFTSHHYRRLPVVRDGKLKGVIARRDLLRYAWEMRLRERARRS